MSNDELYYSSLTDLMVRIIGGLKNRTTPLGDLSQALNQLMSTNTIQGQAADGMKAYISEVHGNLIQVLQTALNNYEMVLSKYVSGYLQVDGNEDFKLVKQDFDAHQQKLSTHRSDFTKLGDQLKTISDEAEDIVWLGGAGGSRLNNVANEMDAMKQTVLNLQKSWDQYESDNRAVFSAVQDLISQTFSLLKQTLTIPRGYSYSLGSFNGLISQSFLSAYQASSDYVNNAQNQKEFSKDWDTISKDYNTDQQRLADAARKKAEEEQKEANQHKGFWEAVFGVAAVALGAAAIILTAGAATPLVAFAWTAGLSAGAYGLSNVFEGTQIMVTGADKAFNPLRDTLFGGNQGAYDTFGNIAMFAAGAVIPVGAALNAGRTATSAIVSGVGRTLVTTVVGAGTNQIVAPIATNLAKSAGLDSVWANDLGTAVGFGTSVLTAREAYKASGVNWSKAGTGDFSNIQGSTYEDAMHRVPNNANKGQFTSSDSIKTGSKANWTSSDGTKNFMEAHSADSSAPEGSNASKGWVTRVKQGNNYLDPTTDTWVKQKSLLPKSGNYNADVANNTHIPIQGPVKLSPYVPVYDERKGQPAW
ncbi:MAG: hypothetical protein LBI13_05555 [Streptococcaceae bacterium]|jgi:hypothetical protein|nr:hypothetical protein [Streptococcaceae bacterium]